MRHPLVVVPTKTDAKSGYRPQAISRVRCPWHLLEIGDSFVDRAPESGNGNWHWRARNQGIEVTVRRLSSGAVLVTRAK